MAVATPPPKYEAPVKPPACRVLGTCVHPLAIADLHALIEQAVATRHRLIVVSQNLHGVYVYHRDEQVRQLHEHAYVRIDGMPLVFWGRTLGYSMQREHRVTWVDWLPRLMQRAAEAPWRMFYLGAQPGVADQAAQVLRQRHEGLSLATHHGHFDAEGAANEAVVDQINAWAPDVLMVGMGMPRQERWVLANQARLEVPVILTCGAAFEYVAGAMATPPRWMGRLGLEWLYRLGSDPQRLWRRYLLEPWALGGLLVADLVKNPARRRP